MLNVLVALATVCTIARTPEGKISRSRESVRSFMRAAPCPAGVDKGSTKRCRGYVVDHVLPLCAGGKDEPANMIWEELVESRAKDKAEVGLCRWIDKECGRGKLWKGAP